MTRQATLKPYKHQITHLGRVEIVISAKKIFFCCENSSVEEGKTRREGPDLPYLPRHQVRKVKRIYTRACRHLLSSVTLPSYTLTPRDRENDWMGNSHSCRRQSLLPPRRSSQLDEDGAPRLEQPRLFLRPRWCHLRVRDALDRSSAPGMSHQFNSPTQPIHSAALTSTVPP